MHFSKYHGSGNDFVILDAEDGGISIKPGDVADLCRRGTGIGADGVIFVEKASAGMDAVMRIFNADGSEAEMCGNGIRCLAKYMYERKGLEKDTMCIGTGSGTREVRLEVSRGRVMEVEVDMGTPEFASLDLPPSLDPSQPGEVVIALE
ncbi:MAG: diaminopimelate epimerase, partial [Actinomycetota bacterium]